MSGIQPVFPGPIPDIVKRCPEYNQKKKVDVRNTASDVRNTASDVRNTASDVRNRANDVRNRDKNPGHVPDINVRCPEHGQDKLAVFRTSMCDVWNVTRIFVPIPDITGRNPDITGCIPDIAGCIPDITGCIPDIILSTKWMSGI